MPTSTTNHVAHWLPADSASSGLAILSLAVTLGLFLGAIRVRRIRLGIPGVLFSALLFGQLGLSVDARVLQFLTNFALILFMYAVGLQVGPGFLSSLQTEGLRLNLLSVAVLIVGAMVTAAVGPVVGRPTVPGLFAGAFTSTPGLAAAQDSFRTMRTVASRHAADEMQAGESDAVRTGIAYSITYPFGIIGPVLVILALKRVCRICMEDERAALAAAEEKRRPPVEVVDFEVTKPEHAGKKLRDLHFLRESGIILARGLRGGLLFVPSAATEINMGDVYRAVGPREALTELVTELGKLNTADLGAATGDVQRMDLVVTRTQVLRRPLHELDLSRRTGVTIAHVSRAGIDLIPRANLRLAFADRVIAVGPRAGLKMVEAELGNSLETLSRSQLIPIFLGIVLGVLVGSIPLAIPGLHASLRIGLAGGPLLAAIALSQFGNIGSIVWYMPAAANQLFRDFGLAVFLACVGLQAGNHFLQRAATGPGLALILCGIAITLIPIFLVALFARLVLRMNFITLTGWIAGAMTSSPALIFSDELAHSDAPAVAYAAVAPLATLVPILCAQILAITSR
jgi:putative transport protein